LRRKKEASTGGRDLDREKKQLLGRKKVEVMPRLHLPGGSFTPQRGEEERSTRKGGMPKSGKENESGQSTTVDWKKIRQREKISEKSQKFLTA